MWHFHTYFILAVYSPSSASPPWPHLTTVSFLLSCFPSHSAPLPFPAPPPLENITSLTGPSLASWLHSQLLPSWEGFNFCDFKMCCREKHKFQWKFGATLQKNIQQELIWLREVTCRGYTHQRQECILLQGWVTFQGNLDFSGWTRH